MSQYEEAADTDEEIELADPDEYHRRERLKEIHERRQQVHKTVDEIERYTTPNQDGLQKTDLIDAVTLYISELEPLIARTDHSPKLPDNLPWNSLTEYADSMGYYQEDGELKSASYTWSLRVFRAGNQYLAEVKPLFEEEDDNEWEV